MRKIRQLYKSSTSYFTILKAFFITFMFVILVPQSVCGQLSDKLLIADFESGKMVNWQEKSFVNSTKYSVGSIDTVTALKAHAQSTASALYRKININLQETSFINWSWRIENLIPDIDERSKQGDDYPARVYVVFKGKYFFTKPRSLIYVWSSNQPKGAYWPSAYDSGCMMIAVRSYEDQTGKWHNEKRNVKQDIKNMFGVDINQIKMVAIMTDSDQSRVELTSWYGNIFFSNK